MIKVYMKGFQRPFAVVGSPLFEDERFYTIMNGTIKRKILWDNILYLEEILDTEIPPPQAPALQPPMTPIPPKEDKTALIDSLIAEASKRKEKQIAAKSVALPHQDPALVVPAPLAQGDPKFTETSDVVKIKANFVGHKNQTVPLYVSASVMDGTYNPNLAREIFTSPEIKSVMGDFFLSGVPKIEGTEIFFETKSLNDVKNKAETAANMLNAVAKASTQFAGKAAPTLAVDPNFSMPGSPFDKPVMFAM